MGPSEKIGGRLKNRDDNDGVEKNMMGRELIRVVENCQWE
jgi:hypothetical protein